MNHDKHLVRLPSKLSTLIRVAVMDVQDAVAAKVEIDLNYWTKLDHRNKKICSVCVAGAVIRGTLVPNSPELQKNFDNYSMLVPRRFGSNQDALIALDYVRNNYIVGACDVLKVYIPHDLKVKLFKFAKHSGKSFSGVISPARSKRMCAHLIKVAVFLETLGL